MNFIKKLILKLIAFYQRFLTHFAYGSCRYYPTCSEYTKREFQYNNLFLAFFNSSKRILSCNQLFEGGVDYPIVSKVKLKFHVKIDKIDFWLVPLKGKERKYYLIKNFSNIKIKQR